LSGGAGAQSAELFERAKRVIPGGVNSPVRAFKSVGGTPPFVASARGATLRDEDGNEYIDFVASYGPLLFGHAPDFVTDAIAAAAVRGTTYGGPTRLEAELAELIVKLVPSIEMVRMVNSGSEATTSAVRLARGATGRTKVVKCAGCFHGSVDSLLVAGGSGVATLGIPDTAGVPQSVAAETIVVEFNDSGAMEDAFSKFGEQIAAVILEPLPANMGVVPPTAGYLQQVRDLTTRHGALLIFDEVISGFRVAAGGAQQLYGITPDLTCLGKIVGGGVPCGAYGGRRDIMEQLAPVGPVYQAGTLSGNPLATSAGLAVLREIERRGDTLYQELEQKSAGFASALQTAFNSAGLTVTIQRMGSLLTPFFSAAPVASYADARRCDTAAFTRFFHRLLSEGVYVPPSQYEAWFLCTAHTPHQLEQTVERVSRAAKAAREQQPALS